MVDPYFMSFTPVGGKDGVNRCGKVGPLVPVSEQVNVLARPLQDAVGGHGVPTGESEAVGTTSSQTYLGQAPVDRRIPLVHYTAGRRSSLNRVSHTLRVCGGSTRFDHNRINVGPSSHRTRSLGWLASRSTVS